MLNVLGIYIHIPFCKSKCDYCDFYSLPGREEQMARYHRALMLHLRSLIPEMKKYSIDTIYFGGGTPSFYGEKRLKEILTLLQRHFPVSRFAEITLECNPDSVSASMLSQLRKAGVNRVSLGMQSADSTQLQCIHRVHTPAQTEQAVQSIRAAGIRNLSLDLIYGLPGQDMESWLESLRRAIALAPEHISCYGLKVEPDTPLAERVDAGEELPDGDLQADMYLAAVDMLRKAGYYQYEISNFAKKGMESRHNLKYWMGQEYIGLGPGAHSFFNGQRYAYRRDLEAYISRLENTQGILEDIHPIDAAEAAREYLLLRMRTIYGIEEWEYRRKFGLNFEPIARKLEFLEQYRWTEQTGHRWHFTPAGFLLSNTLILELLEAQESTLNRLEELQGFFRQDTPPQ